MSLWFKIIVACLPAAVVGVLFDETFEALFYNPVCVSIALIVFGVAFIVIETVNKGKKAKVNSMAELTYTLAMAIGLFQLIAAVFPGTSRSGATILGALILGVSRVVAAEFTFYLAIPVMFGASLLKIVKFGFAFTGTEIAILAIGMITAFAVSLVVIKFLMGYIKKNDFKVFGWYRIALGIAVLAYFAIFA
jgi:undecaprenyl-diphosphatase